MYDAKNQTQLPQIDSVKFHSKGVARIIELTRPKALNSLNLEMVNAISFALQIWEESPACHMVIIKGQKSFCAGGDVRAMVQLRDHIQEQIEFFKNEYTLNHYLGTFRKPIISFIDGVTSKLCLLIVAVGGGIGLSVHGTFRIATENTIASMPEAAIGFFPDVGSSFLLSRMDNSLGMYLALTGRKLIGTDV